jgi:putative transposase
MYKGFKFRIYPNDEQIVLIEKTFGCCRLVYNDALARRKKAYSRRGESISCNQLKNLLPKLKVRLHFLKEVDSTALQQSIMDMDDAYQMFFKGSGFPKFKNKRNLVQSYRTVSATTRIIDGKHIELAKLGVIRCRLHRKVQGVIKSATISRIADKYYVSFCCDIPEIPKLPTNENQIGIDLGVKKFAIDSNNTIYTNPKHLANSLTKLQEEYRKLSRMQKGSSNFRKQSKRIARIHSKIANQRLNHSHQLSRYLVNNFGIICIEDLNVKGMIESIENATMYNKEKHNIRRAYFDAGLGQFINILTYKAEETGRTLVKIGRYIPSSQTCHCCGHRNPAVKDLSIREWVCPNCGEILQRDYNAAINILTEGINIIK